jgi:hypothetical protein
MSWNLPRLKSSNPKSVGQNEHLKQADLNYEQRQEVSKRIRLSENVDLNGIKRSVCLMMF